jgi:uncharacterized RDD family membrane protein YckC
MKQLVWRRVAAYLVDYAILFAVLISVQAGIVALGRGFPYRLLQEGWQIELWVLLSISLPTWLYFAFAEQSPWQATLGKRLLGLQVMTVGGERLAFWRALLRTLIKLIPWELTHLTLLVPTPLWWDASPTLRPGLAIVYILLGVYLVTMWLNPRRQSIHDLIARSVVVRRAGQ